MVVPGKASSTPGEPLADEALRQPEGAQPQLEKVVRRQRADARDDLLLEHRLHLARHARQEVGDALPEADAEPRCGAVQVRQDVRAVGEVGLLGVADAEGSPEASRGAGGCGRARPRHARAPRPGRAATASVVTSSVVGPRPPVDTRTRARPARRWSGLDDAPAVVVDHGVLDDLEADGGELGARARRRWS